MQKAEIIEQLIKETGITKEQAQGVLNILSRPKMLSNNSLVQEGNTLYMTNHPAPSDATQNYPKSSILNELKVKANSKKLIGSLLEITRLPIKTLAKEVFEITPKTLSKYKTENLNLPARITEIVIKLRELYKKGIELFGSPENFKKWLDEPSFGLGNNIPLKFLNTTTGIDLIYEELVRIEFGATA